MKLGGKGGAHTGTGLRFEGDRDLAAAITRVPGFAVSGNQVLREGKAVATLCPKNSLYTTLLAPKGIRSETLISQKLLPDQALFVAEKQAVFIIEIKYQGTPGSVDEKLQTCHFKKRQYTKLFAPHGLKVEYVYVLSDWFKHPRYKDVLAYITDVGCRYFFDEIPMAFLGLLPPPKSPT